MQEHRDDPYHEWLLSPASGRVEYWGVGGDAGGACGEDGHAAALRRLSWNGLGLLRASANLLSTRSTIHKLAVSQRNGAIHNNMVDSG